MKTTLQFSVKSIQSFILAGILSIFSVISVSAQDYWQIQPFDFNSTIDAFAFNAKGDMYAGTFGFGVWRTQDNGTTWTEMNNGLVDLSQAVQSLAINQLTGVMYAGTIFGAHKSTNSGTSWTAIGDSLSSYYSFAIHPNGIVFAGTDSFIQRSSNIGVTWELMTSGNLIEPQVNCLLIQSSPPPSGAILAGTVDNGIMISTDLGVTWSISDTLRTETINVLAVSPVNSQMVFAGTAKKGAYRSTDGGYTWRQTSLFDKNITALTINSVGRIFAGTEKDGIYISADNGLTWKQTNGGLKSGEAISALTSAAKTGYVFVGAVGKSFYRNILLASDKSSIDFGTVRIASQTSATIKVTNNGTALLAVNSVTVDGTNKTKFTIDTTPFSLASNETKTLTVKFSPTVPGVHTAKVTFTSNAIGSVSVDLTGNGLNTSLLTSSITLNQLIVGKSQDTTVKICNESGVDLVLQSATLSGDLSSFQFNGTPLISQLPINLKKDSCLSVSLKFMPTKIGSNKLLIIVQTSQGKDTVSVAGNGTPANDVQENQAGNFLFIRPNPASEMISVQLSSETVNPSVKIFDLLGNTIFTIEKYESGMPINISELSAGMYELVIETQGKHTILPLVITR